MDDAYKIFSRGDYFYVTYNGHRVGGYYKTVYAAERYILQHEHMIKFNSGKIKERVK